MTPSFSQEMYIAFHADCGLIGFLIEIIIRKTDKHLINKVGDIHRRFLRRRDSE